MSGGDLPALPEGPYISLATYRRDGREVATPLWFVELDGRLYAYTRRDSGKVKRLRNDPVVKVAPCTFRGRPTGPWRPGRATPVEPPERVRAVYAAMARKYGWSYRLGTLLARLSGNLGRRLVLEIALEPAAAD